MKTQKTRAIALLLALLLLLTGCGGGSSDVSDFSQDAELSRALEWGLIPEDWSADSLHKNVKCSEFCKMLSTVVGLYDPAAVPVFEAEVAQQLKSNESLYHVDQLVAIYTAAVSMGLGEAANGDWTQIYEGARDWTWELNSNAFAGQRLKTAPFYDVEWSLRCPGWDYNTTSRFWIYAQFSRVSGKTILDYEPLSEGEVHYEADTMSDTYLTRETAIRAAVRLYESVLSPAVVIEPTNPDIIALYEAADERREAILNSETAIVKSDTWEQGKTYSGKAYYVSEDGSDKNNGRSPAKAWKTLDKVNKAKLKPGDAVFLRRGDTWHGSILMQSGVTYSAYGEGAKPIISGSIADIADAKNWTLHSDTHGAKIWRYKDAVTDVAGIFMNDNSLWAEKRMPGWDGQNYVSRDGTPFVLEETLSENLTYVSLPDLTDQPLNYSVGDDHTTGPLYLRCDEGNPGEVFSDIQFSMSKAEGVAAADAFGKKVTLDNLAFRYCGIAIGLEGLVGWTDALVQNCDIGWGGGSFKGYVEMEGKGYALPECSGGAILMSGCGHRAVNNYIHDVDSKVFILTIHYRGEKIPTIYENVEISGNLVERSGTALQIMSCMELYDVQQEAGFRNLVFADNYVMNTGEGWITEKLRQEDVYKDSGIRSTINGMGIADAFLEDVQIRNNVFANSEYALVGLNTPRENSPVFSGNTYVQYENGWLAQINGRMIALTENGLENIRRELGDETATFYLMN